MQKVNWVNSYELFYTNQAKPQHMLRAVKASADMALSRSDNVRMSEWLLRKMDFDKPIQAKAKAFGILDHDVSAIRVEDYITHIHNVMQDEITGRFEQPYMTDDEAGEILFEQILKKELDRIKPKDTTININMG